MPLPLNKCGRETADGTPCKRPTEGGKACSMHGGSTSPKSPKRSPSSSPKKVSIFESMPADMIQLILLNKSPDEIKMACDLHPRVKRVCKSKAFKDAYANQYPSFYGESFIRVQPSGLAIDRWKEVPDAKKGTRWYRGNKGSVVQVYVDDHPREPVMVWYITLTSKGVLGIDWSTFGDVEIRLSSDAITVMDLISYNKESDEAFVHSEMDTPFVTGPSIERTKTGFRCVKVADDKPGSYFVDVLNEAKLKDLALLYGKNCNKNAALISSALAINLGRFL